MNLLHQVTSKLAEMIGAPKGVAINPLAALDALAEKVVKHHLMVKAVIVDREAMRLLLCAIAFDFGLRDGQLENILLLEWPPDPPPKEEKPKVEIIKPGLVSLH